jgi:ADP-heptose:LPS heptosyltransferase
MKRKKIFRFFDRYLGIPLVIFLAIITGTKRRLPIESIKNILFIKLAAIGDSILLIPTLRKLKNSFPDSKLTFICSDINHEIIEKIPYVDKIINFKVYDIIKHPINFLRFLKKLRKTKFDLVIDAGQWERINSIITALVNKNYSIGFKTKGQWKHFVYDAVVDHVKDKHEVENFFDLLQPIGIIPITSPMPYDELQLEYFFKPEHREFSSNFWVENDLLNKKVICMHPGCGEQGKPREWDVQKYITVAKNLYEKDKDIRIIITGTNIELKLCNILYDEIKDYAINTAGKYSIDQTAALIEKSDLIICSNTGILHVSACVGTSSIGLHGPTNPKKWGAYGKKANIVQSDKYCSPCLYLGHDYGCNVHTCMQNINSDQVLIKVKKILYTN